MSKICSAISSVLLVIILLLVLAFAGPMLLGYKELAVLSGSMEPTIPVGSIVYVDTKTSADELAEQDVVTYALSSGTYVTHRVISIDTASQTLVTQGDANDVSDGEIAFSQVFGLVKFHIPYLGFVSTGIRTPAGILTVTCVVVVIVLLNTLPALLKKEEKTDTK